MPQVWTIDFTKKNGFLGVYFLASWPNAAFDMCGMACGYLDMSFWTFFGACVCGKGFTKVILQAVACITVFRKALFDEMMTLLGYVPVVGVGFAGKGSQLREQVMYNFSLQERFTVEEFLKKVGTPAHASRDDLIRKYCELQEHCGMHRPSPVSHANLFPPCPNPVARVSVRSYEVSVCHARVVCPHLMRPLV